MLRWLHACAGSEGLARLAATLDVTDYVPWRIHNRVSPKSVSGFA